jgi:ABC-type antimicrobial peptide transport system permease subunit
MILASIGVYGLISYRVSLVRHELGMRMALGAPHRTILRLVLRHGMMLAGIGVVIGLGASLAITRLMKAMLFGVSATDGPTYVGVAGFLLTIVLLACFVPARRATTVDPLDALRAD